MTRLTNNCEWNWEDCSICEDSHRESTVTPWPRWFRLNKESFIYRTKTGTRRIVKVKEFIYVWWSISIDNTVCEQHQFVLNRKLTGSQCKSNKIGEMCSEGFVRVTSLAAVFCFSCSLWIWSLGSPNKIALPMSKRDDTKAWTNCSVACGLRYLRILEDFWAEMMQIW